MAPKKAMSSDDKEKEEQKRFNRQINFYFMRHMWQLVCKRSIWHSMDTIYNALNIRRERYTRVIDNGNIRYSNIELNDLVKITGLPKEIFTGEMRFACKYSTRQGNTTLIKSISNEEWRELFTWRNKRQELRAKIKLAEEDGAGENEVKKIKDEYDRLAKDTQHEEHIQKLLEKVKKAETENNDFQNLCYFMKERKPAPKESLEEVIAEFEKTVRAFGFDILDECSIDDLERIQKLLKARVNLINSIIIYKRAKAGKKKK